MTERPTQKALELAYDLADDRLRLIEQREIEERDGAEEAQLKLAMTILTHQIQDSMEDQLRLIMEDCITEVREYFGDGCRLVEDSETIIMNQIEIMRNRILEVINLHKENKNE